MKLTIAIFTMAVITMSCNSGAKEKVKLSTKVDTTRLLGCFVDFPKKEVRWDMITEITKDRVLVDSFLKTTVVRDTSYFVNFTSDTTNTYFFIPKEMVRAERNLDSNINQLLRWIKENDNQFPSDSLTKKPKEK